VGLDLLILLLLLRIRAFFYGRAPEQEEEFERYGGLDYERKRPHLRVIK